MLRLRDREAVTNFDVACFGPWSEQLEALKQACSSSCKEELHICSLAFVWLYNTAHIDKCVFFQLFESTRPSMGCQGLGGLSQQMTSMNTCSDSSCMVDVCCALTTH